jgi:hypothetical protein
MAYVVANGRSLSTVAILSLPLEGLLPHQATFHRRYGCIPRLFSDSYVLQPLIHPLRLR